MKVYQTVATLLGKILSQSPGDMGMGFLLTPANVAPVEVAKLAIACEEAFGFPLYDEKIAEWRTLADVCNHIEQLLEEGQAEPTERTQEERTAWFYE